MERESRHDDARQIGELFPERGRHCATRVLNVSLVGYPRGAGRTLVPPRDVHPPAWGTAAAAVKQGGGRGGEGRGGEGRRGGRGLDASKKPNNRCSRTKKSVAAWVTRIKLRRLDPRYQLIDTLSAPFDQLKIASRS